MARYEWTNNDQPIRGELSPRQVADMTAAGTALAILREYIAWRDNGEFHAGEHTEAEAAAMAADGWTVKRLADGVSVNHPVIDASAPDGWREMTAAEVSAARAAQQLADLLLQAERLLASPDLLDAVQQVILRVQAVAALGVDISDWSFQGVTAAAEQAAAKDQAGALQIAIASLALRTAWDRVIYHLKDMKLADDMWPYLYEVATRG